MLKLRIYWGGNPLGRFLAHVANGLKVKFK